MSCSDCHPVELRIRNISASWQLTDVEDDIIKTNLILQLPPFVAFFYINKQQSY
jgi:hypothetical protein